MAHSKVCVPVTIWDTARTVLVHRTSSMAKHGTHENGGGGRLLLEHGMEEISPE